MFTLVSCNDVGRSGARVSDETLSSNENSSSNNSQNGGNLSLPGDGNFQNGGSAEIAKVEIRHLIEPKLKTTDLGGSFVRKLTMPKNYKGKLYLGGLNVGSLASHNIYVRFKLGREQNPITLKGTISYAPGITNSASSEVIVIDLKSRPFENVRLPYDLYDYNQYSFDGSSSTLALDEPVSDNRNGRLFCRGLKLEDDPTFSGVVNNGCTEATDECRYAYAKVVDKGLIKQVGASLVTTFPTLMNMDLSSNGYFDDGMTNKLSKCLPDSASAFKLDNTYTFDYGDNFSISGTNYFYLGPFYPINFSEWEISGDALDTGYGVYQNLISPPLTASMYGSYLFPRYTKVAVQAGVDYLGASSPGGAFAVTANSTDGQSEWMSGCNARVSTSDSFTGENIGSCNVTALIEVFAKNSDGSETAIDTSKEIKLQLVAPSSYNTEQVNVLLSGFRACENSNNCGGDECCFNNRCWSKELVSQCPEEGTSYGQKIIGESCETDLQCSSLCCQSSSGTCQVHNTNLDPAVLCNKPSGQRCIAKEFCMQHSVRRCFVVTTGVTGTGVTTCALRCYNYLVHGDCRNGYCIPPIQPSIPTFNPNDPNACSAAIDPSEVPSSLGESP